MPHDTPLIATIVAGLGLAFVFGALANRFRIPPLVGYLLAGVAGRPVHAGLRRRPATWRSELAEIGVILLMFGVGLHFSLKDLLSVRAIAVPGRRRADRASRPRWASGSRWLLGWRSAPGWCSAWRCRWPAPSCCCAPCRSAGCIETERGRIAVGWLIVEDLAMVLALVLLPALAGVLGGDRRRQPAARAARARPVARARPDAGQGRRVRRR